MLDKKYTQAYKNVVAGETLKNKILIQAEENFQKENRSVKLIRRGSYLACAACLALIIGVGAITQGAGNKYAQVCYNDEVIGYDVAEIKESGVRAVSFGAESVKASGLPLEIKTRKTTKVSVTDGELLVFEESYDDLMFVGTNFTTDKTVLLFWNLSDATDTEPKLIVENNDEHSEYTLSESKENGYIIKLTVRETKN